MKYLIKRVVKYKMEYSFFSVFVEGTAEEPFLEPSEDSLFAFRCEVKKGR